MPGPIYRLLIVIFWLVMTGWLVKTEVIPRMGFGDVDFQSVLAERAVTETARWNVDLDGENIGTASTTIQPNPDGSFAISNELRLSVAKILSQEIAEKARFSTDLRLYVSSEMLVDALGRLESLRIEFSPWDSAGRIDIDGAVEGKQLVLRTSGAEDVPFIPQTMHIPIDREDLFADRLVPYDRLPDLRIGKKWTTRTINPLAGAPQPVGWLFAANAVEVTLSEVISIENVSVRGKRYRCFMIEHRRGDSVSRTWVLKSNGQVLRRDASFLGRTITFSLESAPQD